MQQVLKWTGLTVLAAALGLALAFAFTRLVRSQRAASRISIDQAVAAAEQYIASYGNPDLALAEVMEFSENYYAAVEEHGTGFHAFEIIIDPYTGAVAPEPGPNMMWNERYGHMGGRGNRQGTGMSVSPQRAQEIAQAWLDRYLPGATVAGADAFYGYYTLHTLQDGQVTGMLSVNGADGSVWYHDWHGEFIGMVEMEEGS